ncbi:MAG: hypothetical protein Q7U54_10035 [Bacteroidales bacterium]|nr:hypothetical protein [Bacteroidales bacterium]
MNIYNDVFQILIIINKLSLKWTFEKRSVLVVSFIDITAVSVE